MKRFYSCNKNPFKWNKHIKSLGEKCPICSQSFPIAYYECASCKYFIAPDFDAYPYRIRLLAPIASLMRMEAEQIPKLQNASLAQILNYIQIAYERGKFK